jgi:hypothetical protein
MIKNGGERIGNRTRVKVVKNKIAPPFKEAEFDIMFGTGISKEGDILDLAAEVNIINKSGSWYSYEGNKIGQGREAAKSYLMQHMHILQKVEKELREYYHLQLNPTFITEGITTEGIATEGIAAEGNTSEDIITKDIKTNDIKTNDIKTKDIRTKTIKTKDTKTKDTKTKDIKTEDMKT